MTFLIWFVCKNVNGIIDKIFDLKPDRSIYDTDLALVLFAVFSNILQSAK